MSDEFDEFDDFEVDDSFFREVDDIEARATARPVQPPNPPKAANVVNKAVSYPPANAEAGPSRRPAAIGMRLPRPQPQPSSDDFEDLSFTAESLAQIDSVATTAPRVQLGVRPPSTLPSSNGSRALGRTSSGSGRLSLQTHLHFRREAPTYTKGKRWDRTAFAASGRRVGAEKSKKKGKSRAQWDDDEEEDDEAEELDILAPPPKLAVDLREYHRIPR